MLLVSCSSLPEPLSVDEHLSRLVIAEQLWRSHNITSYQYREKSDGRSDDPYNPFSKVFSKSQKEPNVDDLLGVIIKIKDSEYLSSYYENDPDYDAMYFGGFDKAFMGVRETLDHMKNESGLYLEVDYHPQYGFPTRIISRQYKDNRLISIGFLYIDQYQIN